MAVARIASTALPPAASSYRFSFNPRQRVALGLVMFVLVITASCKVADKPVAVSPQHLATLFAKLQSGDTAPDIQAVLAETRNALRTDPNWPALTYLVGEAYLKRKDLEQARATFRDLAVWAASDQSAGPYKDQWGGSGLAAIGLWRWLRIVDLHGGTPGEVEQALKVAAALQGTRLYAGMVRSSLLPALPLIEEDVARLSAHLAWRAKRPEATALFLGFVSIDSTGELDATDELIQKSMLDQGLATPERLDLFRFRRQLSLVNTEPRKQRAAEKLRALWENQNAPPEVRAEAGYEWSNFYRQSKEKRSTVVAVLTSAFDLAGGSGSIAEKALFRRGMVHNSVDPKRPDAFFGDMNLLLDRFPNGRLADDALYQVATEHLFGAAPDQERAFSYFEKLRALQGTNDWMDSAHFLAALGLVDRGTAADLKAADRLLAGYVERFPDGAFRLRSLFWRGRIAERDNDTAAAQGFFQRVVDEAPYDYYGLRASMHLEGGASVISMALPRANSKTWGRVREAYRKRGPDVELEGTTPYHDRLRAAQHNGLYRQLLAIVDGLGRRFRNRLDNIRLQELDEQNLIPAAALLLALRQDALAARDSALTADNQLRLAGFMGRKLGDWPTALAMTFVRDDASHRRIIELQNDPRFLATVYPGIDALGTLKEALADAAWQIDDSTALSESLMYGVIRRESAYYSGAISAVGALGLFQIMPLTFEKRPECWTPRTTGQKPTPTSYLFDPVRNTQFWSCWVRKEFDPRTRDGIALMLVNHHAGADRLGAWMKTWKGRAIERDLELQIDTYRFPATRVFVRYVLSDVAIADAGGLFETGAGTSRRHNR
jgi:soluble lytic murein transglycosylase-like protein